MSELRECSLFTGIGGGLLGSLILGWEPVQFVEHDAYCQGVLRTRFPDVPLHPDVRDFHPTVPCDIVTGGFPCQPFSQAGKQEGEDDPRNMWPDTIRVLVESGAPLGFFENVPGLLGFDYFGTILGNLAEAGFDAEWCVMGADDVGAPHIRKRLWILAYSHGYDARMHARAVGSAQGAAGRDAPVDLPDGCRPLPSGGPWWFDPADVPDTDAERLQGGGIHDESGEEVPYAAGRSGSDEPLGSGPEDDPWIAQPYVGRVAPRAPSWVDRIRGIGNSQCPQCMAAAFTYLAREAGILR